MTDARDFDPDASVEFVQAAEADFQKHEREQPHRLEQLARRQVELSK